MTTTLDDGATHGAGVVPGHAPGGRVVVDRTAECYVPGSAPALERTRLRYLVVHCTGLSEPGADNPHPITDSDLDGPALAGRFLSTPALGTGQAIPYHGLTTFAGANEQILPLSRRGAHAVGYNSESWAWAIVGENAPAEPSLLERLADVCAALVVLAGGIEIVGHTDLAGASRDPRKTCPRPTVDIAQLRALVRERVPSGWQIMTTEQREDYAVSAGLRL